MLEASDVKGVIAAIVTPFTDSGEIDKDALRAVTSYLIDGGVHGIMTCGGTGEFPSLSRDERAQVTQLVAEETRGRALIFAGSAACSTWETVELSRDADRAGADAVIVTAPYYFPLPRPSLFDHYRVVADSVDLPVVVYNNPLYTGNNLTPDLMSELADVEGIVGVKQSNADLGQTVELIRLAGARTSVCTGIDSQFYPSLCAGASGIFSTAACVIPETMVQIYDAFQKGDHDVAGDLHRASQALNRFLEYDPGYVAPCKEALRQLGLCGAYVRPPLPQMTNEEQTALTQALAVLGVERSVPTA